LRGIDWTKQPVPVLPAAHYWMGGIATDLDGRTSVAGLYAVGEVACTGVHGANRLASNSLLEGIVFGARAATAIASPFGNTPHFEPTVLEADTGAHSSCTRDDVRLLMWDCAGLIRDAASLRVAQKQLANWSSDDLTVANMLMVARLIVSGALTRKESRGAHFRADLSDAGSEKRHLDWVWC